ncbi:MAG: PAS domain S-box protein [Phycisphaera sp. RhM]|nr:PAS domain S-box protein [Phycisphaera sp. RhM]
MPVPSFDSGKSSALRKRAEQLLNESPAESAPRDMSDIKSLIHELEVYQMELELQNEELCRTHTELETTRDRYQTLYDTAPVGYLTLDRQGVIHEANSTVAALLDVRRENLIGTPLSDVVVPEDQDVWHIHRTNVFTGEGPRSDELRLERSDESTIFVQLESRCEANGDDSPHCRMAVIDISARRKAEEQRRASQLQFRQLLDQLPNAAYTCNADGLITCFNNQAVKLWGREPKLNNPVDRFCGSFKLLASDGSPLRHERSWIALALKEDKGYCEQEIIIRRPDGTSRTAMAHANPIYDEEGKLTGAVNVLVDITDRNRAETALQEGEQRFRKLCQHFPVGIYMKDTEGNCVFANDECLQTTDLTFEQVSGPNWVDAIHPDDRDRIVNVWTQFEERRDRFHAEYRFRTPAGKVTWVQSTSVPFAADGDSDGGFIGTLVNITDRKQAEQELAAHAERQRVASELSQLALAETDLSQLMDAMTAKVAKTLDVEYCKILELLPDRTKLLLKSGVGWRDGLVGTVFIPADNDSQAGYTLSLNEPVIVADLHTDNRFHGPRLLTEHGVVSGMSVIVGSLEQPHGVLGVHTTHQREFTDDDIRFIQVIANLLAQAIDRQRLEDSLRQSNEELEERVRQRTQQLQESNKHLQESVSRNQQILETTLDGFVLTDAQSKIMDVNPAYCSMIGYTRDELIGMSITDLDPSFPDEDFRRHLPEFERTGRARFERKHRHRDGHLIDLEISVSRMPVSENLRIGAFVRDVTDRKRAERERDQALARFETIAAHVTDCFWSKLIDGDGTLTVEYVSPRWETIWGYLSQEIYDDADLWLKAVVPDDLPLARDAFAGAIAAGTRQTATYRIRSKRGDERWIEDTMTPAVDENGRVVRVVGVARDITERKRAELLLAGQNRVLELLSHGETLDEAISTLIDSIEQVDPDVIASVLLLDDEDCVHKLGRNQLPDDYNQAVEGQKIGPQAGSCGTCAYRGERVVVDDILTHSYWELYREFATRAGLRACWSEPIFSSAGEVLGTFALYYRTVRAPDDADLNRIHSLAHVAGIAIERKRAQDALRTTQFSVDQSADGIYWVDPDANFIYVNEAAVRMSGYTRDELLQMSVFDVDPLFSRSQWGDLWRRADVSLPLVIESKSRRKDGTEFPIELSLTLMHYGDDQFMVGFVRDITERRRMHAELQQKTDQLEAIFAASPDIYFECDEDGRVVNFWKGNEAELFRPPHEFVGKRVLEFIPAPDAQRIHEALLQVSQNKVSVSVEYSLPMPQGERWFEARLVTLPKDHVMAFVRDITERKVAETTIRVAEERWRSLIENSPGHISIADRNGVIQFVNRTTPDYEGLDVVGKTYFDFTRKDQHEVLRRALETVFRKRQPVVCELQDFEDRWYERYFGPMLEDGEVTTVMLVSLEITERKQSKQTLANQKQLLEEAQMMVHLGNWEWDVQTNQLTWSDELYRIYGLDPQQDEITFERFMEAVHPDYREAIQQDFQRTLETGEQFMQNERIRRPDGSERILLSRGHVIRDEQDQPIKLRGTCLDVTEQRYEEMRFRGLLEAAPDAMVIVDETGTLTLVNQQTERLFGYDREELLGQPVELLIPQSLRGGHVELRNGYFQQPSVRPMGRGLDLRGVRKDGSEFSVEISLSPLATPIGILITAAIRDVTQRKRAEDELRLSEKRLSEAHRVGQIGSWEWDMTADTTWWSAELYRLCGVDPQQFTPSLESFFELIVPDDRQSVRNHAQATIEHGEPFEVEYRINLNDFHRFHVCTAELLRDDTGQPRRLLGTVRDVTEQRQLQRELRRSERLNSLGTLAAGIAHEINNPMSAAWTAADTARAVKGKPEKDDILDESLDAIVSSVRRCKVIIDNMLRFAREASSAKEPHDLHSIVQNAVSTMEFFVKHHMATLDVDLADDMPNVRVNASEIEQVLVNILRNAVQSGQRTLVSVRTERNEQGISVRVTDNGKGIPEEHLERIFDPFFTHQETAKGTGLGLAISHGIIEDHGGTIDVESHVGEGTSFTVTLPLAASGKLNS